MLNRSEQSNNVSAEPVQTVKKRKPRTGPIWQCSLLGDGYLGGGVVADLLDELALLADDAPAETIVRQHLQYHLPDQRR